MNHVLALQTVEAEGFDESLVSVSSASNRCSSASNSNCTNSGGSSVD